MLCPMVYESRNTIMVTEIKYLDTDLDDMIYALDSVLTTINSDDDPWLYNNTWRAMELLKGLKVKGFGNE